LSKLSQFDPETNFTAWMGRIVRFIALNHARRKLRTSSASVDPHTLDAVVTKPNQLSEPVLNGRGELFPGQENFDDRVLSALGALDETARACLLLRTLMEMPYKDISLALDIAEGTAMSHVHRARAALRQRLGYEPALIDHHGQRDQHIGENLGSLGGRLHE
jgi:RNA polymerase sigma-70 factor, ECF subfamily